MHPKLKAVGYAICALLIATLLVTYAIALVHLREFDAIKVESHAGIAIAAVHLMGCLAGLNQIAKFLIRAEDLWRTSSNGG